MIKVYYLYYSKSENKWKSGVSEFTDVEKCRRFMYAQRKKDVIISNYVCDYPEDTSYLNLRVNLMYINRGKVYAR